MLELIQQSIFNLSSLNYYEDNNYHDNTVLIQVYALILMCIENNLIWM